MTSKLIAAINAVQAEMSKGTSGMLECVVSGVRNYDGEDTMDWVIYTIATYPADSVINLHIASGWGGLNDSFAPLEHGPYNGRNIAALLNAAPGMLDEARRCIENSQLVLNYQTHDDVYTAVSAMLTPLFAQYAHLSEVQALEVTE